MNDADTKVLFSVMKDRDVAVEEWKKCEKEGITNTKLRAEIVDLADIWDGPVSSHYGNRLEEILKDLGIRDVPEFYKKENIDKFIKEMRHE